MPSSTLLTRALRRALFDPRYGLPPAFLLPWTAGLHITTTAPESSAPPTPQSQSYPQTSIRPQSSIASPKLRSSASKPASALATVPEIADETVVLSQSVRDLLPMLREQSQIYLAAHIQGKAYLVTKGDTIRLPFVMPDVEPGDTIRLTNALYIGSRDLTLKPAAARAKVDGIHTSSSNQDIEASIGTQEVPSQPLSPPAPHYIPHIAKGKHSYLDERLFVCRASVIGVESEPLRVMEKTKRRQRHVKHVRSKHRSTILKIAELRVRSINELERDVSN